MKMLLKNLLKERINSSSPKNEKTQLVGIESLKTYGELFSKKNI